MAEVSKPPEYANTTFLMFFFAAKAMIYSFTICCFQFSQQRVTG